MTGNPILLTLVLLVVVAISVEHLLGSRDHKTRHDHTLQCPAECHTCNSHGSCTRCVPGRYGARCRQFCHANCYTCSSSGLCTTCTDSSNVYGPLCNKDCNRCTNEECDRFRCRNGCKDGFYESQHQALPGHPTYYRCDSCPDTCVSCRSRSNCMGCISRRWGRTCDKKCLGGCYTCHQITGKCRDTACELGKYIGLDGHCKNCPPSCLAYYTWEVHCSECIGQRRGKTCVTVICTSIGHCSECECVTNACDTSAIACLQCEDGYCGECCDRKCDEDLEGTTSDVPFMIKTPTTPRTDEIVGNAIPTQTASFWNAKYMWVLLVVYIAKYIIHFLVL